MDIFRAFIILTLSCVLGAPVDVDKRRESTPEILGLEQQLKKAAGENKKYFSNPNARPMPQIDGLDKNNEELQKSVKAGKMPPPEQHNNGNDITENDSISQDLADKDQQMLEGNVGLNQAGTKEDSEPPPESEAYLVMIKLLKQHPEYMEQFLQEYLEVPANEPMTDFRDRYPSNFRGDYAPQQDNLASLMTGYGGNDNNMYKR